jgi:hypothetical protein
MKTEIEIRREIEGPRHLTSTQLKEKYREVFGEDSLNASAAAPSRSRTLPAWP